jgi:hypothetical protein
MGCRKQRRRTNTALTATRIFIRDPALLIFILQVSSRDFDQRFDLLVA